MIYILKWEAVMKRIFSVLFILIFSFVLVSCTTVKISTNKGAYAFVVNEDFKQEPKTTRSKQCWYILWGLVPLGDNSTKDLINAKEKVSVRTSTTPMDFLMSMILGIATITTRTIEVDVF